MGEVGGRRQSPETLVMELTGTCVAPSVIMVVPLMFWTEEATPETVRVGLIVPPLVSVAANYIV